MNHLPFSSYTQPKDNIAPRRYILAFITPSFDPAYAILALRCAIRSLRSPKKLTAAHTLRRRTPSRVGVEK